MRDVVVIVPSQVTWHVVEMQSDPKRSESFVTANAHPHMLRRILQPYATTHHVVSALRRRAPSGLSSLRLILDPLHSAGEHLVIHASLLTLPAIVQAA